MSRSPRPRHGSALKEILEKVMCEENALFASYIFLLLWDRLLASTFLSDIIKNVSQKFQFTSYTIVNTHVSGTYLIIRECLPTT